MNDEYRNIAEELLLALQAVGAMPEGCCFCYGHGRDAKKPEEEHVGECREARAAIKKAEASGLGHR